jgi:hypothetical protein
MRYLFKLYHSNVEWIVRFPTKEIPDSIPTKYFIGDEKAYERVKSQQIPLSQLPWFVSGEFEDNEEQEHFKSMTDDDYFLHTVRVKCVSFIQKLQYKWFDLIKSSKKTVDVYLFAQSPLQCGEECAFGQSLDGNLRIFVSASLIEKLLDKFKYRTHICPSLMVQPEFDLLFGLDFKMIPWRAGLAHEHPKGFTELWMFWLWTLRNQGLARFAALNTGAGIEMAPYKIRLSLEKLMKELIDGIENGDFSLRKFHDFIRKHRKYVREIAPQLMLHALKVYCDHGTPKGMAEILGKLNSSFEIYNDKILNKPFVYARKIEFDQFLEYLTLPTKDSPPMISEVLLRKLNRMMLILDKKGSLIKAILNDTTEHLFYLELLERKEKGRCATLEGVRIKLDFTVVGRFHLLAENWS